MKRALVAVCALALAGCGTTARIQPREEAARLRASFERYQSDYRSAIQAENRLTAQTLAWLDGSAASAPRAQAAAEARRFTELWANAYFVPRYLHQQLRPAEYFSPEVRAAQQRMLDHLKRRYLELHDYQRYAQFASETGLQNAPPGQLPPRLREFRRRLEARAPASDQVTPILESLRH